MHLCKRGFLFVTVRVKQKRKGGPAERVSACVDEVRDVSKQKEDGTLDALLEGRVIDGIGEGKSKGSSDASDAVCEGRSEGAI